MGNNNLEEKNVSMPEKIGGVIFGIWFVASIIAGFVASEIGTDAVMLVVGQSFAGIVLVIILKTLIPMIKKRKRGSIIGIVFISVFAGAASALIWAACAVKDGSFADKIVLLPERILGRENCNVGAFYAEIFACAFFVVSAITLLSVICKRKALERRCSFTVKAVCHDVRADMRQDMRAGRRYPEAGVFEFTYRDKQYKVYEQTYVYGLNISKGDVVYLYINPENPYEFYLENSGIFSSQAIWSAVFLMVISGLMAAGCNLLIFR